MVTGARQDSRHSRLTGTYCGIVHTTVMRGGLRDCSCLQPQAANPGLARLRRALRRRANAGPEGLALYLALLRAGFGQPVCLHTAGALLPHHFTLAHLTAGGMFLCHFPSGRPAWVLPSALPCGARTFLSRRKRRPRTLSPLRVYCSTLAQNLRHGNARAVLL